MKVLCYSSFTFSYLNRARVLFQTLRRFHGQRQSARVLAGRDEARIGEAGVRDAEARPEIERAGVEVGLLQIFVQLLRSGQIRIAIAEVLRRLPGGRKREHQHEDDGQQTRAAHTAHLSLHP